MILFGSRARGTSHDESDWDILALLQEQVDIQLKKEYRDLLFEVEEPISTLIFSKLDWETKHAVTPLCENIKNDGVRL